MAEGALAAFEVDAVDRARRAGWSVVVTGPVEDLDADVIPFVTPGLAPWPAAADDRLLLIRSEAITGQRIVSDPADPSPVPAGRQVAAPADAPVVARRIISGDEALALLRSGQEPVGRLAVCPGGEPLVFPLNYAVDGDAIVFRTEAGAKLSAITRSLATFEVDHIDGSGHGWAVTFEGLAQEVLDADPAGLRDRIAALALDAWPGGERPHVVRITPYAVRGVRWIPVDTSAAVAGGAGRATTV
jgi:nitroimidazol reductase NimA-like FMN-containing flavoprotein (pyridoxamine 5'-phosphate oxidase superfamily)